jgi:hypothetical protein
MPQEIQRRAFSARRLQCPYPGCKRWLKNTSGLKRHQNSAHNYSLTLPAGRRAYVEEVEDEEAPGRHHGLIRDYHETLTGKYFTAISTGSSSYLI